jgi:hypothetical protein
MNGIIPVARQMKPKWRSITALAAAVLMPAAFIVVIVTSPISELHISIQNTDDYDTVHIVIYLDDSARAYLYAGPGGWATWIFHVSPGTYDVGIDFVFNYSDDNGHDGIVDFVWTTKVGFNGMNCCWLMADKEGIAYHPADFMFPQTALPLEQAVSEPSVIVSSAMLAVLYVLLLADICGYFRNTEGR